MSSNILGDKDRNCQLIAMNPAATDKQQSTKSLQFHRQALESKIQKGETQYISPSDQIMSPATQKLATFRNKHLMKNPKKPIALFAKSGMRNMESAGDTPLMFADIPKRSQAGSNDTPSA